jgi:simple sugar transport system ATP-binding protein
MSDTPVLSARGIVKRYGNVEALRGVDFDAYAGEIVALIGDNGAGKSTLVKVLVGDIEPTEGSIVFNGSPVSFKSRQEARSLGIEIVYQDLAIARHLEPAENFFMNREKYKFGSLGNMLGILDRHSMRTEMTDALTDLGVQLRETVCRIGDLSGGQQQGIAVARAAHWAKRLVFLDEPTAALGVKQTQGVLDLVKRVRDKGLAVVYISHDIPEILQVTDRVHVLRRGETIAKFKTSDIDEHTLVSAMTGAL